MLRGRLFLQKLSWARRLTPFFFFFFFSEAPMQGCSHAGNYGASCRRTIQVHPRTLWGSPPFVALRRALQLPKKNPATAGGAGRRRKRATWRKLFGAGGLCHRFSGRAMHPAAVSVPPQCLKASYEKKKKKRVGTRQPTTAHRRLRTSSNVMSSGGGRCGLRQG